MLPKMLQTIWGGENKLRNAWHTQTCVHFTVVLQLRLARRCDNGLKITTLCFICDTERFEGGVPPLWAGDLTGEG